MPKGKTGKHDKELTLLRAQVEALKAELAEKRKSEPTINASPAQRTAVSYSISRSGTIKSSQGYRSATSLGGGLMTQDVGLIKKDLIKSLILSAIFILLVAALKILSPHISFLPF